MIGVVEGDMAAAVTAATAPLEGESRLLVLQFVLARGQAAAHELIRCLYIPAVGQRVSLNGTRLARFCQLANERTC